MTLKLNHNNSGLMKANQVKLEMSYPKFVTEQILLRGRKQKSQEVQLRGDDLNDSADSDEADLTKMDRFRRN